MKYIRKPIFGIALLSVAAWSLPTNATLLPADLDITGSVSFDTTGSVPFFGTGSQTGELEKVIGGVSTTSSVSDVTVTGDNPQSGVLTSINDGVGASGIITGNIGDAVDGFFFDFAFDLANNSITDSFQVFFEIVFTGTVDANGSDSYMTRELNLFDATSSEFFFSDITSDTFAGGDGDEKNGSLLSTFGDVVNDAGSMLFNFVLGANSTNSFTGQMIFDGADFEEDGSFSSSSSAFIRVVSIDNLTAPPPPPESVSTPSGTSLFFAAVAAFGFTLRRKMRKEML